MPNIPPLVSHMPDAQSLYAPYTSAGGGEGPTGPTGPAGPDGPTGPTGPTATVYPVGIATGLSFTPTGTGYFYADIVGVSSLLTATSVCTVTMECPPSGLDDAAAAWIVSAEPLTAAGGTIRVYCAANPTTPLAMTFSWVIHQF